MNAPRLLPCVVCVLGWLSLTVAGQDRDTSRRAPVEYRIGTGDSAGLQQLLAYSDEQLPIVSGHRGGATAGLPENCLATFQHTVQHAFALLEVDPRYTKDGAIVLHHDARLERTTTGQGLVADRTLEELKQLRLKDPSGLATEWRIPTLDEALDWARNRAVLVLDQKDIPVAARAAKIEEHRAEGYALLIVYNFRDVRACYERNPNILMEVMIPDHERLAEFDRLGVPWRNVIAFVGHTPPRDTTLYDAIHARGARCLVGTSRNLDRRVLEQRVERIDSLEPEYRAILGRGADLFETDIPAELGPLLYGRQSEPAHRGRFLSIGTRSIP
ncbi:MAG: glycerophosphodiester phosphodiesterase family protein [Pirellulaceae bacterium]